MFLLLTLASSVQWKDPSAEKPSVIHNQGFKDKIGNTYYRLPDEARSEVRSDIWELSRHAAGLQVRFYTNSKQIQVKYELLPENESIKWNTRTLPTMGLVAKSGIDMYALDRNGYPHILSGEWEFGDQYIIWTFNGIPGNGTNYEFDLYLTNYNGYKSMVIGIDDNCNFHYIPPPSEEAIVIYGTSIVHGVGLNRPGNSWCNVVARHLDAPYINLGMSGNAFLEPEVIKYAIQNPARLYILDCIPNLLDYPYDNVTKLVYNAVKQVRAAWPDTPILLADDGGVVHHVQDAEKERFVHSNKASQDAVKKLRDEGVKGLHYVTIQDLNFTDETFIDTNHLSDYGARSQVKAFEAKIREILDMPIGNISTTQPIMQNRYRDLGKWRFRHEDILNATRVLKPKSAFLGDSITQLWGGEPLDPQQQGRESWDQYLAPQGFVNLGIYADRIENLLYRVYHDELLNVNAEKIIIMIGTNNIDWNTDEEIIIGLRFLYQQVQKRQPNAKIKIIAIPPYRNQESRIKTLNVEVKKLAEEMKFQYYDPGPKLLDSQGKIDPTCFQGDGVHPSKKGYELIAEDVSKFE